MHDLFAMILTGLVLISTGLARAGESTSTSTNSAIVPVSKLEQDAYDWFERHSEVLDIQKNLDPEIVLVGDSITHFWGGVPQARQNGTKSWADTFGDHRVLNMGFGWDRTQNVLWRLDHGELDDTHPKVVVLNIGGNNFTETHNARANTPEEVAEAILAICEKIKAKSPTARIVVMGIFPRGAKTDDPARIPLQATNKLLANLLKGKRLITFLDISDQFLNADGSISPRTMSDATHPTEQGYAIWGKALTTAGIFQ